MSEAEKFRDWLADQFEDRLEQHRANGEPECAAELAAVIAFIRACEIKTLPALASQGNTEPGKVLTWPDDEDRPLPEDDEIDAAHPLVTGDHKSYEEALRLVGARRSKGALVELVCWLLHKRQGHTERGGQ